MNPTAFLVAVMAASIGAAEMAILHETHLSVFMSTLPNINSTASDEGLAAVDSGAAAALIMLFPNGITSPNLVAVPVGTVSVCVAYSLASGVSGTPALPLSTLGAMLLGNASGLNVTNADRRQPMLDVAHVNIVLVNESGSSAVLLSALRDAKIHGFLGSTSFPPAVFANPRVRFVADRAAVAAEIAMGGNTIGFLTFLYATSQRIPCAKIATFDNVRYSDEYLSPRLDAADAAQYFVNMTGLTSKPVANLLYPITGVVAVVVGRGIACSGIPTGTELLQLFLLRDEFRSAMRQWGVLPLRPTAVVGALKLMKDELCLPETRVKIGGSAALKQAMCDFSVQYQAESDFAFIEYISTTNEDGIAGVKADAYIMGTTTISNTASQQASNPTLAYLPIAFFGITLVYSFPSNVQLVIPKCALVAIFNGSMTHWDDLVLLAANLGASLPHEPIQIIVPGSSTSATQAFMDGLDQMDRACNDGVSTALEPSRILSTVSTFASYEAQIEALRDTPWSLGYLPIANGRPSGLAEAALSDSSTNAQTGPDTAAIQRTLSSAVVDADTVAVSLDPPAGGWPFVRTTYVVFDMDRMGNCTAFAEGIRFVYDILDDPQMRTRFDANYLVPTPDLITELSKSYLKDAKCDGQYVYPRSSTSSKLSAVVVAVVAVLGAIAAGGLCALYFCTRHSARNIRHAPKDASIPFTVAFTDIQASTALWAQMPEVMAPALDAHHEIIRALIAKHKAYEVKTIGDAFMIVSSSVESLVRIALEIQDEFQAHEWGTDLIDELYQQQAEDMREYVPHVPAALPDAEYAALWRGLRVRVGVHYGFGDIRLDEVSKGYDYYGSVVNTAARTESIAHGGQVLLSSAAVEALHSSDRQLLSSLTVVDLGHQALKGLDVPVSIHQVSRGPFVRRRFPPLRLERAADVTDASSTADGPAATTASSTRSGGPPQDATGVLVSLLAKSDRSKVVAMLCASWRVSFDRSQMDAATSALTNRVVAVMSQRGPVSVGKPMSRSRDSHRASNRSNRTRDSHSCSTSLTPIEMFDHSQTTLGSEA